MDVSHETSALNSAWKDRLRVLLAQSIASDQLESVAEKSTTLTEAILESNPLLHLVSQKDPSTELLKQITDSSMIARLVSLRPGCRLLDVGSGAGFPGIILKLIFPEIELHSLDSSPRKIAFQREICSRLDIAAAFHSEDFRRFRTDRPLDIAVVKAVGSHRDIIRKSGGWLGTQGRLIFMEGRVPNPAIEATVRTSRTLSLLQVSRYLLPGFGSVRHLVTICRK